jgi:hypothetical protein
MKILFVALLAAPALADTPPVPQVFKGMQGQKGQYEVEILEPAGKSPKMTVCTDNVVKSSGDGKRGGASCTYKLLKDTADEAVIESTCDGRTSRTTIKRESAKTLLMSLETAGSAKGSRTMKMRYTHLGACREGQGMVTLDKNSEQCKKIRQQLAQMDPAKQCARQKANREECEQRIGETRKQLAAMCG